MKNSHFHIFERNAEDKEITHYDCTIIGAGPAGLTAAIYSARYGLHTALIGKEIGGMANYAHKIENYPGYEGSGFDLMQKFYKQALDHGAEFLNSEVGNVGKDKTGYVIELIDGKVVHSKTLIIALGTEKKKLEIPGEHELVGKGVSYCATCDAAFFKNKEVAVVGGGDSACSAALIVSEFAKKVYLIYKGDSVKCDKYLQNKIDNNKIELILNSLPKKIKGVSFVSSLVIESKGKTKEINVQGVFIEIGAIPVTSIIKKLGIKTDKSGFIIVDDNMATNVPGIFAAGDFIKSSLKQVVVAAAQGAMAAKSASDFVNTIR